MQMCDFSSAQQIERGEIAFTNATGCEVNGLAIIFNKSAKEVDVAPKAIPDDGYEQRVNIKSTMFAQAWGRSEPGRVASPGVRRISVG
jgi:hypothetical protein